MTPKECMPFIKAAVDPLQQNNKNLFRAVIFFGSALAGAVGFKLTGFQF
jgi:hypothetical protein